MTIPFGLAQPGQPQAPPPRRGLLDRLFPGGALGGLLDPDALSRLQNQQLMRTGLGLLANSGPRPVGTSSVMGDIGQALQQGVGGWEQQLQGAAQNAMGMQQMQQEQQSRQAIARIVAEDPPKDGETPDQTYARVGRMVSRLAGQPGTADLVGKLSNVMAQLRPQRPPAGVSPEEWDRRRAAQAADRERLARLQASLRPSPSSSGRPQDAVERKANMGAATSIESIDEILAAMEGNPDAMRTPTVTSIARGAARLPVVGSALSGLTEPIAQGAMSGPQSIVDNATNRLTHSSVGLLAGNRQALALFYSLLDTIRANQGTSPELIANKTKALRRMRALLVHYYPEGAATAESVSGGLDDPPPDDTEGPPPQQTIGGRPIAPAYVPRFHVP